MKTLIFSLVLFSALTCNAEQSCYYQWDGTTYKVWNMNAGPIAIDQTFQDRVSYKVFNPTTSSFDTKYANVEYKVVQVTLAEQRSATCPTRGVGDYDRDVTAVKFEAVSAEPVFGSPTDGAPSTSKKVWALCRGNYFQPCL